ncbi:MAG: hypothetical protein LUP94_00880, partial [Candidatus Methanomethylicus sp.]|nr:hypothetical protein [Candidatus Methanomethylicus sp.]
NGGIFQRIPEQANATPVNYISVEDVDTYTTRVTKEGGRILMQKQHIPKVGWIAIVEDPEGNPFGLITPSME